MLNYKFTQKLKEIVNLIILPYNCNRHNVEMYRYLATKNSPTNGRHRLKLFKKKKKKKKNSPTNIVL